MSFPSSFISRDIRVADPLYLNYFPILHHEQLIRKAALCHFTGWSDIKMSTMSTLMLAILFANTSADKAQTVITPLGPIQGKATNNAVVFRGIQYATAKRFEEPVAVEPWNTTIQAARDGPACPQRCKLPYAVCPLPTSEQCLFMNMCESGAHRQVLEAAGFDTLDRRM